MKIKKMVLGWKDMCCGCNSLIPGDEKVYIVTEIGGIQGSLHFCKNCMDKIANISNKENGYEIVHCATSECIYMLHGKCTLNKHHENEALNINDSGECLSFSDDEDDL